MASNSDKAAERFQMAILTLFMTAGGFLLITGILAYWLNPRVDQEVEDAQRTYEQLTALLSNKEFAALRDQAKAAAEQETDKSPMEIIQENLAKFGLSYKTLPKERRKATGSRASAQGQRTVEVTQRIDLEAAGIVPITQFVAAVLDAKKSIRVETFDLTHDRRSDGDSWTASIEFIDYEKPSGS